MKKTFSVIPCLLPKLQIIQLKQILHLITQGNEYYYQLGLNTIYGFFDQREFSKETFTKLKCFC